MNCTPEDEVWCRGAGEGVQRRSKKLRDMGLEELCTGFWRDFPTKKDNLMVL